MQTEKRVNVDDLRDILKFWEMKDEIEQFAARVYWGIEYKATLEYEALALKTKIESIGKKEGE